MAKVKRQTRTSARAVQSKTGFNLDKYIPPKYQAPLLLVVIFLIFLIYFAPLYFGGKTFQSGDILTSKSMETYLEADSEGFTLWNPYVFCGMPSYALSIGFKWFNMLYVVVSGARSIFESVFTADYAKWTFYLLLLSYTMFFFMKDRTKNNLVALFSALMTSFSTGIIVFLYIGHVTKLTSLCMYPLIFLLLLKLQKKITFFDVMLLIVTLYIFIMGWHVQIIFYTLLSIAIFYLFYLIKYLKEKESAQVKQLLKTAGILAASLVIALLIQLDSFTQVWEYSPYSTRGTKSILEESSGASVKSESDFYQYATNWSFSPGEVMTFIIPSYYGFGKSTYKGTLTEGREVEVNTYFGQMMFVDVAMYMGVIVFFLGLFSIYVNWKEPFVKFLTILSAFALLVSFGRNFSVVYDLMFHYFPFFDKFRVPSMILVLLQLSFPMLAGFGIWKIVQAGKDRNEQITKIVQYITILLGGVFVLAIVLGSPIREWFVGRVAASGQKGEQLKPLYDYMADMFITDFRLAFFFGFAVFALSLIYSKGKITSSLLVLAIIILSLIDLFRINSRGETYTEVNQINQIFNKPDYISVIENQNDPSIYRLINLKQDGSIGSLNQNSNFHAYFLKQDMYGYSGIKPRGYQDIMDIVGSPANPTLWRMLNVKYIVLDKQYAMQGLKIINAAEGTVVYENTQALPRAYFVDRIETKPALAILNNIKNNAFDPKQIAYVEKEELHIEAPDSTANVKILNYGDEHILIQVNASGNNFLFLGDTYIPVGWKAFIDGKETTIYRTNHNFRGIVVPIGAHKIEFVYEPESFVISKYIVLTLSSLTLVGLVLGFFMNRKKAKTEPATSEA